MVTVAAAPSAAFTVQVTLTGSSGSGAQDPQPVVPFAHENDDITGGVVSPGGDAGYSLRG
jgi:hypothetical protein